jgi:hypothetical protein
MLAPGSPTARLCSPDLLCLQLEGYQNPGIEGWSQLEGKTAQARDNPVAGAEILQAWSASGKMLAKRLFLLR